MKNEDLHHYISHFGDFSPVTVKIDIVTENFKHEFIFASSEKPDDVETIVDKEQIKENFYF